MLKLILFALVLTSCISSYPTVSEVSEIFEDPDVEKCEDIVAAMITDLIHKGWRPSQPNISDQGVTFSLTKGNFRKLIVVMDAAKRWDVSKSAEYLGFCVARGARIGHVMQDTVTVPPIPSEIIIR